MKSKEIIPATEAEVRSNNPWLVSDKNDYNYYYHQAIIKNLCSKRVAKKMSLRNFGSLTNYLAQSNPQSFPRVGDGATQYMWTDRHAYCVTGVDNKQLIVELTQLSPKWVGTGYGDETYEYKDENGNWLVSKNARPFALKFKLGRWYLYNPSTRTCNGRANFGFGHAEEYRDPCF